MTTTLAYLTYFKVMKRANNMAFGPWCNFGTATFSIRALSITTLSLKFSFHSAEQRSVLTAIMPLFIVMLNVGMLSAIILNAFMLSVTRP